MNSKLRTLVLAIAAMGMLSSCPETKVGRDFGETRVPLKAEEWNGEWSPAGEPGESLRLEVKDAAKGLLTVTLHDQKTHKDEVMEAAIRHAGTDSKSPLYFLVTFDKPGDAAGSVQYLSRKEGNAFYRWLPRHNAMASAIEKGRLKGTVTRKGKDDWMSHLESDPANYKALSSPEYWEWNTPDGYFRQSPSKAVP